MQESEGSVQGFLAEGVLSVFVGLINRVLVLRDGVRGGGGVFPEGKAPVAGREAGL